MANPEKNRNLYKKIVMTLEDLARGDYVEDMEEVFPRAHSLFLAGYKAREEIQIPSDFVGTTLKNIERYYELRRKRIKKFIAGGEREITPEDEAFESLHLAESISRSIIVPFFTRKNSFSNSIFKDIYNLSFAYLHSITGAVADQYIPIEETLNSKFIAVDIAKKATRFLSAYCQNSNIRENRALIEIGKLFRNSLRDSQPDYIRPFELVPTDQKNIYRKEDLIKKISEEIFAKNSGGKLKFTPSVIFPIAQGGNELGIRLSIAYEDQGYSPITYPLLYSIKTRKHRYPWIQNDSQFLGKNLEGENLLVVEDWVTTGNTLRGVLNRLENVYPREIRIATLKRDPEKSKIPLFDKYYFYIGAWALYPGAKTDSIKEMDL